MPNQQPNLEQQQIEKKEKITKELTIKNFRFWILIIGIIFLILGTFFYYFGENPCPPLYLPGSETPLMCDHGGPYTFKMLIFNLSWLVQIIGIFLIIVSIILYISLYISKYISNKLYRKTKKLEEQVNQTSPPPNNLPQNPKFNLKYILIVLILAAAVVGILVWQYPVIIIPVEPITKDVTANWQIYRNEKYGFSIVLPPLWMIAQETEGSENVKLSSYMFVKKNDYEEYKNDFTNPTKLIVPILSQIEIIMLNRNWTSVRDMSVTDYLAIPVGAFEVSLKESKKESINGIDFYFYKRNVDVNGTKEEQTGIVWNSGDARYDLFTFRASANRNLEKFIKEMAMSFKSEN